MIKEWTTPNTRHGGILEPPHDVLRPRRTRNPIPPSFERAREEATLAMARDDAPPDERQEQRGHAAATMEHLSQDHAGEGFGRTGSRAQVEDTWVWRISSCRDDAERSAWRFGLGGAAEFREQCARRSTRSRALVLKQETKTSGAQPGAALEFLCGSPATI